MQEEDRWLFLPSLRQPTPCSRRRETSAAVCCKGEIFRPHTTRDGLECYHVFRVHVIKQRVRHFIGLLRELRLCSVHSHGFNVRRVLRVLRELLLPRWPRLSRAEFVLGATILMACPAIPLRTVSSILSHWHPYLTKNLRGSHQAAISHQTGKANRGARARALDFVPDVRASSQHWGVSCLCASPAGVSSVRPCAALRFEMADVAADSDSGDETTG